MLTAWVLVISITATAPSGGGIGTAVTTVPMLMEKDCYAAKAKIEHENRDTHAVCLATGIGP